LLKLWLFPFVWALTRALRDLLRRFAGGSTRLLPLIVLSPAVLSTVNLMLDVPALALGLTAFSLFARAADRDSRWLAAVAGLLAGLAIQTKYTMFAIPPVIAWYGATHRRLGLAAIAVAAAVTVFAGWELLLVAHYGHSHFFFQLAQHRRFLKPSERTLGGLVRVKAGLISPLLRHLGCLGIGVGLAAAAALGLSRRWLLVAATIWAVGLVRIALVPYAWTAVTPALANAAALFWQAFGLLTLIALAACAAALALRRREKRWSPDASFLVGWLLIELGAYFVLTPFPAARRVIELVVVGGLFAAHVVSRIGRTFPVRRPASWIVVFGVATGVAVTAVDTIDVSFEKVSVERARIVTAAAPVGSTVWCLGKWGFHYYCERAGMRPVVAGRSVLVPGDLLVLPVIGEAQGFGPPVTLGMSIRPELSVAELVARSAWNEPLSGQTVTNFYGGSDPVMTRDHPRMGVAVYQLREARVVQ
jgi:hypothetical protein